MRLACVKHAASVRSEPGSNSQVHLNAPHEAPKRTDPNSLSSTSRQASTKLGAVIQSVTVRIKKDTAATPSMYPENPDLIPNLPIHLQPDPTCSRIQNPVGRRQRIPSLASSYVKEPLGITEVRQRRNLPSKEAAL